MGVRQLLSELRNRVEGKTFEVWEEADGSVATYQNGNALVEAKVNPLTGGIINLGDDEYPLRSVFGNAATVGDVSTVANEKQVLSDNSHIHTLSGLRLLQPAGANDAMVVTSAYQSAAVACTIAWTAGNVCAITVPTGHLCVEQDAFVLQVADEANDKKWAEVLRVASVTDGNVLVARLPFIPTTVPVGVVTFRRCVRNVTIDIDVDYNFANNAGAGSTPERMALVLAFMADSTVRVRGRDVFKYLVLAAGCDNCSFDVGSYPNGHSDTFKLYGPSNNNTIKVFGQAAEDCVSLQAMEPASFIGYMPCKGNIRNTRIRDISARVTTAGSGPIVIYADPTYTISGTVIDGGESRALAGTADGLAIRAGSGFSPTNANLIDVSLKNLLIASAGGDCLAVRTPLRKLSVENCVIEGPGDTTKRGIYINNDCDLIEFVNQTFDLSWVGTGTGFYFYCVAAVKALVFRNCKIKGNASLKFLLLAGATAAVETIIFDGCDIETMDVLCRFESSIPNAPTVIIRGGRIASVNAPTNYRKTGGKVILEGPAISGAINGVVRSEGAAVITDVYGFASLATPSQLAVGVSSGKVNLRTPWMTFDHTAAVLNNIDGNEFVTSAAGGTLTVGMPVISNGTAYLCRRDFTKTS